MKNIWTIALLSILLGMLSCSDGDDGTTAVYTVSFEADGGTPAPAAQKIKEGGTVTAPSNPTKTDYTFAYWHMSGASSAYNFQSPVMNNFTLYAKWTAKGGAGGEGGENEEKPGGNEEEKEEPGGTTASSFTIRNTTEWNNAVRAIRAGEKDKSYTLNIIGTVAVPPTTGVKENNPSTYTFGDKGAYTITLTGSGTLALSSPGFLMCLAGTNNVRARLIIDGPTLQGREDNTVNLLRFDYASMELKSGKITGNNNLGGGGSGSGGGIYMKRGGIVMSGGEISNNTCGQKTYHGDGGGVHVTGGSFTMTGGVISGNMGGKGGGLHIDGSFYMEGGVIKGNTARSSSPYGGGVYIASMGSFSKTGGIIYGDEANDADKNKVVNFSNSLLRNKGTAVFCPIDFVIGNADDKRRETTAGEKDHLDTNNNSGWGI